MENKRCSELDSIKFWAIFLIFTTHFIADYKPELLDLWNNYPTKLVLGGITGKFGVALLGVLLGYFAYLGNKKKTLLAYSLKRYGYFVFVGMFINLIYCIYYRLSIVDAVTVSLKLGCDIFPTYWCMREFLFASILAYYIGTVKWSFNDRLVAIILLFLCGQVWIPICLLGILLPDIVNNKCFKKTIWKLFILFIGCLIIKGDESDFTYILYGIFAIICICIIENTDILKKLLSNKITSSLGKRTMAIFVIHPIAYTIITERLLVYEFNLEIIWGICFVIICLLAYPISALFNLYNTRINQIFDTQ